MLITASAPASANFTKLYTPDIVERASVPSFPSYSSCTQTMRATTDGVLLGE